MAAAFAELIRTVKAEPQALRTSKILQNQLGTTSPPKR
jgi:hypothetical protein